MKTVRVISGRGVPLKRSDVDTDQIIPAEWLKRVERTGFEKGLFSTWRDDRNFVLNDERYAGASILVAGKSFGVGSSREHARVASRRSVAMAVTTQVRFSPRSSARKSCISGATSMAFILPIRASCLKRCSSNDSHTQKRASSRTSERVWFTHRRWLPHSSAASRSSLAARSIRRIPARASVTSQAFRNL